MATYTYFAEDLTNTRIDVLYVLPETDQWVVGEDSIGIEIGNDVLPE